MTTWTNGVPDQWGYDRYGPAPTGWETTSEDGRLELLKDHDWAGSYEFTILSVWREIPTGRLAAAVDSGCSCPTPFADLTWEGMLPITKVDDLRVLLETDDIYGFPSWDAQDPGLADLKRAVHEALRDAPHVVDGTATEDAGELEAGS